MFLSCVLLLCLLLRVCGGTLDPDREMCYSRQHRDAAVNTHVALDQKGAVMEARAKPSEKDCILTCCSEDVAPGLKCNLVVYRPPKRLGDLNCQLFHCPSERECPLMTAGAGVNTYNIFKGITHPTTRGRITAKPTAAQLTTTPTTTPTTPTTTPMTTPTTPMTTPTTTPTTPITTPTTTTTPTTPTTTPTSTATSTTPAPTTSSSSSSSRCTEEAPTESESPMILETVTMTTAPATTATSTTQSSTTTTTTKSTSTKAPRPPPRTSLKPSRPKKPSKPSRPETPPVKPVRATPIPTPPPTTPERPPAAVIQLGSDPTRRAFTRGRPVLSLPGKPKVSRVMWKNSLVAIVVITLIFLTLILALAARKAMESFDRRHYTRLELNDLHYEV
ncbi:MANSC domain-containing protein 1 [Cyprinus carpio]|uniref:MANSC domain-containing protein 1 n=1 Tax=Cyprinus carpio TaxID=7962 RepID=A0A9Q9X0V7_CYPCA|nr:MANSC domain-containing protein 1 [Cyprinus carpio]XP_042593090.1 MANSC domain-containing protein 1 [Cyprinus carpio]